MIDALLNETEYEYNELGQQTAMIDANENRWESEYDALGRNISTIYPDLTSSSVEYDDGGRKIAEIDQAGIRTEFLYDENGNLKGVDDAEGGETRYAYDENGNLLTIKDPNDHVTTFTYDELGRKLSRQLPEGQIETWEYQDCCRASSHTDFNGATIAYQYDEMKREILKTYPDTKTVATTYNLRGQVETVTYDLGVKSYDYDQYGRLIKDNKEDGQWIAYKYDITGALVETSYSGGHVVAYTNDILGRLATVTDDNGTTAYTYNDVGSRESMAYPNNTVATYEYDKLNRLLYLENKGPEGVISSYTYTLGLAGNRTKIVEHNGDECDYEYDDLYRLTRESRTGDHAYWIEYTYDTFGNRKEMNNSGMVTTYEHDKNDRLLFEHGFSGTISYSYDDNGNLFYKNESGNEWVYEWDYRNRLMEVYNNSSTVSVFGYDYQGERIYDNTNGSAKHYLADNFNKTRLSQVLREVDQSGDEIVAYTYGDDLLMQSRSEEASYYHYDGSGSVSSLSDLNGNKLNSYTFSAFGLTLAATDLIENDYLFIGERLDPNINFYYLRARYYNPQSGLFASMDPFSGMTSTPASLQKYLYCRGNPIDYVDPSGLIDWTLLSKAFVYIIVGILASIAIPNLILMAAGALHRKWSAYCPSGNWYTLGAGIDPKDFMELEILGNKASGMFTACCFDGFKTKSAGIKRRYCVIEVECYSLSGEIKGEVKIPVKVHVFAAIHNQKDWDNPNITIGYGPAKAGVGEMSLELPGLDVGREIVPGSIEYCRKSKVRCGECEQQCPSCPCGIKKPEYAEYARMWHGYGESMVGFGLFLKGLSY